MLDVQCNRVLRAQRISAPFGSNRRYRSQPQRLKYAAVIGNMRKFIAGFVRTVTHKRRYMPVVIGVLTGGLIVDAANFVLEPMPWREAVANKTKIRWSRHMDAKEKFQQIHYKEIASTILLTAE